MSSEPRTGGDRQPTTRAELLTRQRARLAELSNRRWAARRLGLPIIVSVALLVTGLVWDGDTPSTVRLVVFCLILAGWGWVLWRHVAASRRLEAERRDWAELDRTDAARSLPSGDLDALTATIWDARDSTDLEVVARNVGLANLGAIYGWRPAVSLFVGLATTILAGILVADTLLGPGGGIGRIIGTTASGVVAVSGVVLAWTSGREYWRRQRAWNRTALDRQVYLLRRRALGGPETAPDPRLPVWARPVAVTVVVAAVVFVLSRSASSAPSVFAVAATVLLLLVIGVAAAVARAQGLHIEPMRSGGVDVLSSGPRFVRVDVADDTVEISDAGGTAAGVAIDIETIRHVGSLDSVYPWVPGPVVLITDDEPVVLAGRRARATRTRLAEVLTDRSA